MQRSLFSIVATVLFFFQLNAQIQSHAHKAKISFSEKSFADLAKLGIALDHGIHKTGEYFIGDFSHEELEKIQSAGFAMEMVVNELPASKRTGEVMCPVTPENIPYFPLPSNYPYGSMGGFPTLAEMYESIDEMRTLFPKLITLRKAISTKKTHNGNSIYYVKISDNPEIDESEPEILYTALHHAREPLSMSQLLFYMWHLLENYQYDPAIKKLVDSRELYFVTCLNPDGYEFNRTTMPTGGGFWRKNRRNNNDGSYGIDLNRNYSLGWGHNDDGSSPATSNDTYRGNSAFSEPETQMIKEFVESRDLNIVLNYHTWGDLLIIPWGYSEKLCDDSTQYYAMAHDMTRFNHFKVGTSRATLNYGVNGTSDDWMYGDVLTKKKIFAFTPEVGYSFWPERKDIYPLNVSTQYMNIISAWNAGECVRMTADQSLAIDSETKSIQIHLTRTGIVDAPAKVTISSDFSGILFHQSVNSYSLKAGEPLHADINFDYMTMPSIGDTIHFDILMETGAYSEKIKLTKIFLGNPFWNEEFLTMDKWHSNANKPWSITTEAFVSSPSCFTDSPNSTISGQKEMQTLNYIDIRTAERAYLSFMAKWDLNSEMDYAQIQISTDDFNYEPLCGNYTTTGGAFQDNGNPVYTGKQTEWVREWIDITKYKGERIYLKLVANSSTSNSKQDGIYIDDIKVYSKYYTATENHQKSNFTVYPQPAFDQFILSGESSKIKDIESIVLINQQGQSMNLSYTTNATHVICENKNVPKGIYSVMIHFRTKKPEIQKVIFN